jgi:hypothetical protein
MMNVHTSKYFSYECIIFLLNQVVVVVVAAAAVVVVGRGVCS